VVCHILLERFRRGLQLCFRPHLNRRSIHKVMGPQSYKSLNWRNFGIPTLESWDKMTFGCWPHGQAQRILLGGRWWLPPSLGRGEFYESVFAYGSFVEQKCSSYALTNLLFNLCRSMWVIDLLVILPSPHPGVPACPLPPKCYEPWNTPQLLVLLLFSLFKLTVESIKGVGGALDPFWFMCKLMMTCILLWIY
jgi:hypothetical protein